MMARTKFSDLRDAVVAKPGAPERVAVLRAETLQEIGVNNVPERGQTIATPDGR